jgi:hypothetical protein
LQLILMVHGTKHKTQLVQVTVQQILAVQRGRG